MDIDKIFKEILFALNFELVSSLRQAKRVISEQPSFISGKCVLDELLNSRYASTFRKILGEIKEEQLYQGSIKHGIDHNLRTSILAGYIAFKEKLSEPDFKILLMASIYHDIGRIADNETNNIHGERSSKKIDFLDLNQLSTQEIRILKAIITAHSVPDHVMPAIFKLYKIGDATRATKLANILKDADALDRVRTISGPNKSYIRTTTAKQLILAAYEIYANINSIDGLPHDKWYGIQEYISLMLDKRGCFTQCDSLKSQFSSMSTDKQKLDFVNACRSTAKKCFQRAISSKDSIRIGNRSFDSIDSLCTNWQERRNAEIFLDSQTLQSNITVKLNQSGQLILDTGTLMHGMRFNEAYLENIARCGLIAPMFRDNKGDTVYDRAICVFKVPSKQLLRTYYNDYNTFWYNNNHPRAEAKRLYIDGLYYRRNEEATWFPTNRISEWTPPSEKLLFIIHPVEAIQNLASDKLYNGETMEYQRGYSIPIGIAPCQISGIMPSRDLLSQPQKIEKLKQIFPDKYIVTPDGEIIYTPSNVQIQSETLESSSPPDCYQWIHRLVTGGKRM